MNIAAMVLIIVVSFAFIMALSWLVKRGDRSRFTVSHDGKLMYNGKPVKLDEHEIKISE